MHCCFSTFAIIAIALLSIAGCKHAPDVSAKGAKHPDPIIVPKDQKLMDRAIAKARETQMQFVNALQSKNPDYRSLSIKKPFPVPGETTDGEHMWITNVTWDGKNFAGDVNNDPVSTKAVAFGDHVTVTPQELSDWMYVDHGRLVGGYTVRVLHFQSSPEEQKQFTQETGIQVPPIDF